MKVRAFLPYRRLFVDIVYVVSASSSVSAFSKVRHKQQADIMSVLG